MFSNNFLKNKILLLIFLMTNYAIFTMENNNLEKSTEETEERYQTSIYIPSSLMQLAAIEVSKLAVQIYEEGGYEKFEKYLSILPEHVNKEFIFEQIIKHSNKNRQIFLRRLKEIYNEKKDITEYFDQFNNYCKSLFLADLVVEEPIDEDLVKSLIENINSRWILDCVNTNLLTLYVNLNYDVDRKVKKEQLTKLRNTCKERYQYLTKDINNKNCEMKFSEEIIKRANKIMESVVGLAMDDMTAVGFFFSNLTEFRNLPKAQQIKILEYMFLELTPLSDKNESSTWFFLYQAYGKISEALKLKSEVLEEVLEIYLKILNTFDQTYPQVKNYYNYEMARENLLAQSFGTLHKLDNENLLVQTFRTLVDVIRYLMRAQIVQLLKEVPGKFKHDEISKNIKRAIILLSNFTRNFAKFQISNRLLFKDSIYIRQLNILLSLEDYQLSKDEIDNYFNNLYLLLKESVENIKIEFLTLFSDNNNVVRQEQALQALVQQLIYWLDDYIEQLNENGLIKDEEIKKLILDFKENVIEKFEN